jgi:hypothetical protein
VEVPLHGVPLGGDVDLDAIPGTMLQMIKKLSAFR